jgi:hypothetical protein
MANKLIDVHILVPEKMLKEWDKWILSHFGMARIRTQLIISSVNEKIEREK